MSAHEITDHLARLTPDELQDVQERIHQLRLAKANDARHHSVLCAKEVGGHLVLSGSRVIHQNEMDAILAEFP